MRCDILVVPGERVCLVSCGSVASFRNMAKVRLREAKLDNRTYLNSPIHIHMANMSDTKTCTLSLREELTRENSLTAFLDEVRQEALIK